MQDPIGYAQVSLSKFQSAIQTVASATTISTKSIISAFSILGISINKEVANILAGYTKLILGIKSVADAYSAFDQIAREKSKDAWLASGGDPADERLFVEGWKARHPSTKNAIIAIGESLEEINKLQTSNSNNFTGGKSGSSSSKSFEKHLKYGKKH